MRYFIIPIICLIALVAIYCTRDIPSRSHQVNCFVTDGDTYPPHQISTFNGVSDGNVNSFNIKGKITLFFYDKNDRPVIIDLSKNDCWIY